LFSIDCANASNIVPDCSALINESIIACNSITLFDNSTIIASSTSTFCTSTSSTIQQLHLLSTGASTGTSASITKI
jgi:hypothetical protein